MTRQTIAIAGTTNAPKSCCAARPSVARGWPGHGAVLAALLFVLAGCASHQPKPLDPPAILKELDAVRWPASDSAATAIKPRDLASFAITTNPELSAVRAKLGIQQALLVEAGLFPDPQVGWDAMDVIASQTVDGTSNSVDVLSGLGLMFPLPRPGELDGRVGAAEWRVEEVRKHVAAAEWTLTGAIYNACEELRAAQLLQSQTTALVAVAESTYDYFKRARDAGAATAIQANLALGELQVIRLDVVRTEGRVQQARQALNALVGLPPATNVPLADAEDDPALTAALKNTVAQLTERALEARPDLQALLARYEAAEQEIRVAVSKQFPKVSIGTGISLTLPFFSKFGGPAIQTAIAKRERVGREYRAGLYRARQEIAATHALWQLSEREVDLLTRELLPTAEQNLTLAKEAFRLGEATILEALALQRSLVQMRTRHTEARAERSKRAWTLLAASGWLLPPAPEQTSDRSPSQREQR